MGSVLCIRDSLLKGTTTKRRKNKDGDEESDDDDDDDDDDDTSSSSSDEGEITETKERQFVDVLTKLKTKDPSEYDPNAKMY